MRRFGEWNPTPVRRVASLLPLFFMWVSGTSAFAQEDGEGRTDEYHQELERRIFQYEVVFAEVTEPITSLEKAYEEQLKRIKESCMQKGVLDDALKVQQEIDSFREGSSVVTQSDAAELRRARSTFDSELSRRKRELEGAVRDVDQRFLESLRMYQIQLTQEKRLEEAMEVKAYVEGFKAVPMVEAPKIELFWLPNFEGESVMLEVPVEIARFSQRPDLRNDKLHSIRIPDGVVVTISNGADLASPRKTLTGDESNLDTGTSSLRARISGLGPR